MEQITYSKVNFKKNHRHSPKTRSTEKDAAAIVYADIRTGAPQPHLPSNNPVPDVEKQILTRFSYKTSGVLILIIVLLCCALGYMAYFREPNKNSSWDQMKKFCENSNKSYAGCQLCPYDWLPHGDDCYYYSDVTDRTWNQSRDHCEKIGADLLVIKNREQQEFIQRNLRQRREETYWIGLYHDGDGLRWVDGEHYNSSLFNIMAQSSEGCVLTKAEHYYQDSCNARYRCICLKKALKIDLS